MDEIEVTDAMVCAADDAVATYGLSLTQNMIVDIYLAMAAAAPKRKEAETEATKIGDLAKRIASSVHSRWGERREEYNSLRDHLLAFADEIERRARANP